MSRISSKLPHMQYSNLPRTGLTKRSAVYPRFGQLPTIVGSKQRPVPSKYLERTEEINA